MIKYLRTFLFVLVVPPLVLYCLLVEPRRRRASARRIEEMGLRLRQLGLGEGQAAEVVEAVTAGERDLERKRQELIDHVRQPMGVKLAVGGTAAQLVIAGTLYGSSRGRISWFACLGLGYVLVAALLAGLYMVWEDDS